MEKKEEKLLEGILDSIPQLIEQGRAKIYKHPVPFPEKFIKHWKSDEVRQTMNNALFFIDVKNEEDGTGSVLVIGLNPDFGYYMVGMAQGAYGLYPHKEKGL